MKANPDGEEKEGKVTGLTIIGRVPTSSGMIPTTSSSRSSEERATVGTRGCVRDLDGC